MKSLLGKTGLPFDVHLMIADPDRYIKEFVTENTEFITVHQEACVHLHRTLDYIKSFGVKAGVALNPATSLSTLEWVLEEADLVLVMGVNPGFGGQRFIPSTLGKIRELSALAKLRNPSLEIEMDGGATLENAGAVWEAGARILVAGSSVFGGGQTEERIRAFKAII